MPFKSEKQRRYLWANEPEIARDWTETYGSKIKKADGGIMRVPFQGGGGMDASQPDFSPPSARSTRPSRPSSPDRSPREERIMAGPPSSYTPAQVRTLSDPREKEDFFEQSWSGQPNFLGFGGGYRNLRTPSDTSGGYQSRLSQYGGNILSGIMGVVNPFLGILSQGFQKFGPAFNNFRSSQTLEQFRDKMRGYGRTMPTYSPYLNFGGIETLGQEMPEEINRDEFGFITGRNPVGGLDQLYKDILKAGEYYDPEEDWNLEDFEKWGKQAQGNLTGTLKDYLWQR